MAGHTPFGEIRARKGVETPEDRAMGEAIGRAMDDALRVAQLRETRDLARIEIADAPTSSRENGAEAEYRTDLYLSTLREYIEDLGGRLILTAVFPRREAASAPPAAPEQERKYPPAVPAGRQGASRER